MQPDGIETLARWRERGEWWNGDPGREVHRFIDAQGIRREVIEDVAPEGEDPTSEIRIRRIRDEKVNVANGHYERPRFGTKRTTEVEAVFLHALSAYSQGRSTMHAAEIPAFAATKGYAAALLADRFCLVGAREFVATAKTVDIKPLLGATFEMDDGGEIVLVAKNAEGYRSLSRLITACHLHEPRLFPLCNWQRLEQHREGLMCMTGGSLGIVDLPIIRRDFGTARQNLQRLIQLYGKQDVFVQIERSYLPWQFQAEPYLHQLAEELGVLCVAGGPAFHQEKNDFMTQDVLVCIETLCLIEEIEGRKPARDPLQPQVPLLPRRSLNDERYVPRAENRLARYSDRPDLIENAQRLAGRCEAHVLPGRVDLPRFCQDEDTTLRQIVEAGAFERYANLTRKHRQRLDRELQRLTKLGWSRHFLIAWEMCEWARDERILFSGRGSVVDSMVAYCLGLTRIDAFGFQLHFDRFLPPDGSKRPDIDIDFEAARREDVRQHLVQRYGADHVATVAAIGTYRTRGILREIGKVMSIPEEAITYLAKRLHGGVTSDRLQAALEKRPELRDSNIPKEKFFWVFQLAERMMDIPRNLRAHSSGVVLSDIPIADVVPVQYSGADLVKIIQWDKRSAKHSFDKFDILCLRGQDVLGGTARRVEGLDVNELPLDDPELYRTMRAGHLIGIPQSASPAMRQAHTRIGTQNLMDAAIVQAGIRPGVGGAVKLNEYVARRNGKKFRYTHVDLEEILSPTLGIVVFQEQIDKLLEKFGGYSGDEAESIREAVQKHHERFANKEGCPEILARIIERGYPHHVAHEVYTLVAGFKGYGFAEGHALSFAEVSVRSIYCQQNFPAPYFASLLDAQPAGYYGPVTLANEARSRGVKMLRPDVNWSDERFRVESVKAVDDPQIILPDAGIRVPLKQIAGLSQPMLERALQERPFTSFFDFVIRVNPNRDELESLILVGAFDSFHSNRRALMWGVDQALAHGMAARKQSGCLPFEIADPPFPTGIVDFSLAEKAIYERRLLGLDIERHLMAFERTRVEAKGGLTTAQASTRATNDRVFVVGNPIRLRFPPTSSGKRVMFFDLEDETGLLNVTCFDDVYQRDGHKVICNPYITLWGEAQNRDGHIAFLTHGIVPYRPQMRELSDPALQPIVVGDFLMS